MNDDQLSPEAANLIATVRAERTLSRTARERSYARIGVGLGVAASGVFAARKAAGASAGAAQAAGQTVVIAAKWWVIGGLLVTAGAAGIGAYAGSRTGAADQGHHQALRAHEAVEQKPAKEDTAPAPAASSKAAAVESAEPVPRLEKGKGPGGSGPFAAPARGASRPTTGTATTTPTTAEEVMLLHQARAVSRSNPSSAVALAARHERHYPRSQLAAEREVVMILALCELGRTSEARRRAVALASRSPALTALEGSCAEQR